MDNRPDRDAVLMQHALLVAQRSTCSRLQVGAIIARNGRILSSGYNGAPAGMPHCHHDLIDANPCTVAVHAEANAIAFAARHGTWVDGADLYTTDSPCLTCAQLIVNAGIATVHYHRPYRLTLGLDLLDHANVEVYFQQ